MDLYYDGDNWLKHRIVGYEPHCYWIRDRLNPHFHIAVSFNAIVWC